MEQRCANESLPEEWWRIEPDSGVRICTVDVGDDTSGYYLGDAPLCDAGMIGTNIDATFGSSRYFTDVEARRLLSDRVVPASVSPYDDATTELLESIDGLWTLVDQSYQKRWGRPANEVERRFIAAYALSAMRPR
jgi:hypothetical protein